MAKAQPPPAHIRTRDETIHEMKDQLRALGILAAQFGKGETWAAKLMATVIYTICHDGTGRTLSLISQLGMRQNLQCITSALDPVPGNLVTMPLMLGIRVSVGADGGFFPRFLHSDVTKFEWMPFEEWWEQPVYSKSENNIITRNKLVRAVRSTDGGGHYDAELTSRDYVNLRAGAGWKNHSDGTDLVEPNAAHLLTIWAIGWELAVSMNGRARLKQPAPKGT